MFNFLKRKIRTNDDNRKIRTNENNMYRTLDDWLQDNMNLTSDVYIYVKEDNAFRYMCRCIPSNMTLDYYSKYKNNRIIEVYSIIRFKDKEYVILLSD